MSPVKKSASSQGKTLQRVSTGIPNLDRLIEGGFVKATTNLLVGGSGCGKTIFATQFLLEGIRNGEKCLYISFEEKKSHFYANMKTFGWDLETLENQKYLYFLEYSPEKVKVMLEEGGGVIESLVLREKISRIVIDSITAFTLLFKNELEMRESSLELLDLLRKWSCTSLLIFEEEVSGIMKATTGALEFESDSIIMLYFVRSGKSRQRLLEILKMRGTNHAKEIYPFDITPGGIQLETSPAETQN